MGSSKERCSCCSNRGDQKDIRKVKSQSLISALNKIFPNASIIAGMPVCVVCCKLAHKFIKSERNIGNKITSFFFFSNA